MKTVNIMVWIERIWWYGPIASDLSDDDSDLSDDGVSDDNVLSQRCRSDLSHREDTRY